MYRYYNANVLNNDTADCVIRAVSNAEGKSWDETYEELSDLAQEGGIILDDVNFVEDYLDDRYERACHYAKTVGEFAEEHPRGVYLVTMPRTYYINYRPELCMILLTALIDVCGVRG